MNVIQHFSFKPSDRCKGKWTTDGKPPRGFWIAGDDGKWVSAHAAFNKARTITLFNEKVPKPRYVRYAFAGVPDINLINAAKLPAIPFRTDSFKP